MGVGLAGTGVAVGGTGVAVGGAAVAGAGSVLAAAGVAVSSSDPPHATIVARTIRADSNKTIHLEFAERMGYSSILKSAQYGNA
jgi:hypothetical protein